MSSSELPEVHCPECDENFTLEDDESLEEGDERTCPKCSAVLELHEIETIRYGFWFAKDKKAEKPQAESEQS